MNWTRNYPLREGHYWYRAKPKDTPEAVEVKLVGGKLQAQPSTLPAPIKVRLIPGEWSDEPASLPTTS